MKEAFEKSDIPRGNTSTRLLVQLNMELAYTLCLIR